MKLGAALIGKLQGHVGGWERIPTADREELAGKMLAANGMSPDDELTAERELEMQAVVEKWKGSRCYNMEGMRRLNAAWKA